jgi:hypothetical protein
MPVDIFPYASIIVGILPGAVPICLQYGRGGGEAPHIEIQVKMGMWTE